MDSVIKYISEPKNFEDPNHVSKFFDHNGVTILANPEKAWSCVKKLNVDKSSTAIAMTMQIILLNPKV